MHRVRLIHDKVKRKNFSQRFKKRLTIFNGCLTLLCLWNSTTKLCNIRISISSIHPFIWLPDAHLQSAAITITYMVCSCLLIAEPKKVFVQVIGHFSFNLLTTCQHSWCQLIYKVRELAVTTSSLNKALCSKYFFRIPGFLAAVILVPGWFPSFNLLLFHLSSCRLSSGCDSSTVDSTTILKWPFALATLDAWSYCLLFLGRKKALSCSVPSRRIFDFFMFFDQVETSQVSGLARGLLKTYCTRVLRYAFAFAKDSSRNCALIWSGLPNGVS